MEGPLVVTETIIMKMPALAVVGPDHRITRSTESFRRRYEDAERLCRQSPEIEHVLTGRTNAATVCVGDLSVEVQAVTDATGRRQAMLTLPVEPVPTAGESPVEALRDAAEESPAIVWVKDLEGRYLYANPRYAGDLGTSLEQLEGQTDADLPEAATVDGPRLRYAEDGLEEPLQLEYTVPAIERRPALAAFRFPLRDVRGEPIATCGVAAPVAKATVARDEAVRLMQLERWNRLDPVDVRAELLEQWHVHAAPPAPAETDGDEQEGAQEYLEVPLTSGSDVSSREDRVSRPEPTPAPLSAQAPSPAAPSLSDTAELLQTDLQLARKWADRADQLQGELQQAQAQVHQAESEAQQALAAAARSQDEAERCRAELERTQAELEQAQAELEQARAEAQAARSELDAGRTVLELAQAEADVARSETEAVRSEVEAVRSEVEAVRIELEQAQADADAARSEAEAVRIALGEAQAEADAARSALETAQIEVSAAQAQAESLRGPSTAALRLSEELARALAVERERGEELEQTLTRLRAQLTDFESVFEVEQVAAARAA
jgi:PAS domain-containing protein/predicted  nucleic acid-binding Zn-ribbon protein